MDDGPFRVYGTAALFEHDRLKCWVYLNQHISVQDWPSGYQVQTPLNELAAKLDDEQTSIWSANTKH